MKQAMATAAKTDHDKPEITGRYVARARALGDESLPAVVREIALLFDGRRTVQQVAYQAQISEARVNAVVRKLTAMGLLQFRISSVTATTRSLISVASDFSPLEEGFFAAEVGPIDECDEPFPSLGERIRAAISEMMIRLRRQDALG